MSESLTDEIDRLRDAIEDKPPPADVRLLASANRHLAAEVERLTECMRRAGLAALMRDKSPEDVAAHLDSVLASYADANRRERDSAAILEGANRALAVEVERLTADLAAVEEKRRVATVIANRMTRERDEANARAEAAVAMLRRLEWLHRRADKQDVPTCPKCGVAWNNPRGHADYCELAALLADEP